MITTSFLYELIGVIVAASLFALLTKPAESELSRHSLMRHKKKRSKKSRYETRWTEPSVREPLVAQKDSRSSTTDEPPKDLPEPGQTVG